MVIIMMDKQAVPSNKYGTEMKFISQPSKVCLSQYFTRIEEAAGIVFANPVCSFER